MHARCMYQAQRTLCPHACRSICISTATHRPLNACASKQLPCSWSAPKQSSLGCQQGRLWQLQSDGRSTRTRTYARRPWAGDLEDTPKLIKTRKKHSGGKPHPPSPSPTSKADQEGGDAHSSGHNSRERGDTKQRCLHDLRASSKSTHRPHSKTVYMHQQTMRPRELGALSMEELQALVEQITHSEVLPAAEVFKANTQARGEVLRFKHLLHSIQACVRIYPFAACLLSFRRQAALLSSYPQPPSRARHRHWCGALCVQAFLHYHSTDSRRIM